jgi:carboxyl-terminal processing protease
MALHEARVKSDAGFRSLQEDAAELEHQRRKNLVSLNEATRRMERDAEAARLRSRETRRDAGTGEHGNAPGKEPVAGTGGSLADDGLQTDERNLANELAVEKVRKNAKDVLLDEAVHILSDEVGVLESGARLAARAKPVSRMMAE